MEVLNKLYPNKEQMEAFLEPGADDQICMVNLLKYRTHAEYEDGRETDLTGEQAYGVYSDAVQELLKPIGGYIGFAAPVKRLAIGEIDELWDAVALAVWPSRAAMLEVMASEAMQAISHHRAAGLAGQLNIETTDFAGDWLKR